MPAVTQPAHQKGDYFVDYEQKLFEDVKAAPGEKALVTFHTVAFEGSIGFVNLLQATRLKRKGFETSILLYGPGVTLGVQRGFRERRPLIGRVWFVGDGRDAVAVAGAAQRESGRHAGHSGSDDDRPRAHR